MLQGGAPGWLHWGPHEDIAEGEAPPLHETVHGTAVMSLLLRWPLFLENCLGYNARSKSSAVLLKARRVLSADASLVARQPVQVRIFHIRMQPCRLPRQGSYLFSPWG